ncbi:putative IclR family transcriptional regulator [Gordonia effusa NBRC 100432]|uniref:Putative IclR family transcriptional regulator n=1 Tax=Gordonia effusa NBRC 100432 TaxID=1077974 RepID=H0R4G6_9ACTN|nr:helix-turn-helix domain-containing protein [Gordonia effusa]GAB19967.1 putative IclR family transcriptional regulator [Gordonia effusa NBRC 100432]
MTQTVSDDAKSRQPSPPTERAIRVIELLADRSIAPMTLADIVRRTGQSRATAHAIVSELIAQRWAVRDRVTGAIDIGPGFTSLAASVSPPDPVIELARPRTTALHNSLGIPCFVARRSSPDTISVAIATWSTDAPADSRATELPWLTGDRPIRLRPPISREFFAWATPAEQDAWISRAPAALRTRLRLALAAVAERGYSIERMSDDYVALMDALNSLGTASDSLRSRMSDILTELTTIDYLADELHGEVPVITIGAPIFDDDGSVIAALVACPNATMATSAVVDVGRTVREAADEVTAAYRGLDHRRESR